MVATRLAEHRLWRLRRRLGPHQLGACPADRLTVPRNSFQRHIIVPNGEMRGNYSMLVNNLAPLESYANSVATAKM